MEQHLFVAAISAFLISGGIYFFGKRNGASVALALSAPVLTLVLSVFTLRDEFGLWTLQLILGLFYCLIASALGVFLVGRFTKKRHQSH